MKKIPLLENNQMYDIIQLLRILKDSDLDSVKILKIKNMLHVIDNKYHIKDLEDTLYKLGAGISMVEEITKKITSSDI